MTHRRNLFSSLLLLAALWAAGFCTDWIVVWLAVAGGVLVVDRLGAEPVVLRALDQEADHGML